MSYAKSQTRKLRVLDLFSGIGGFSLGLEATGGFETAAFCEIDDYADQVLEKHWPGVMSYEDIAMITNERLEQDGIGQIDVICGGFPCQDISTAGKGAGLSGERSGLWFEYARIIREVGPAFVIIENVSQLRNKGLVTVLQNLSEIGYDAEWHCIPASYVGRRHLRDRIWLVAYPMRERVAVGRPVRPTQEYDRQRHHLGGGGHRVSRGQSCPQAGGVEDVPCGRLTLQRSAPWVSEVSGMGRVAHGVPKRVDRLRCLGNAVVPQIPEMIGYAILERHYG